MPPLDLLIFDMDGVLVDVSESYRDAVRRTAQIYMEDVIGNTHTVGDLVTREDVAALKMAGGFNNDWDLTTAILEYLLARLDLPRPNGAPANSPLAKDIPAFAAQVQAQGGGLSAVRGILGAARHPHLSSELVKRIFEEVYLGDVLFAQDYGQVPRFIRGDGLIGRELLIPNFQSLISLSTRLPLGIATGRPRRQAEYALDRFGIRHLFRSLVTLEDIQAAEEREFNRTGQRIALGKPNPFGLEEAVRRITGGSVRAGYIGDTPDDMRAAKRAHHLAIGCLAVAEDKALLGRKLEQAGADLVIEHPDQLLEVLK